MLSGNPVWILKDLNSRSWKKKKKRKERKIGETLLCNSPRGPLWPPKRLLFFQRVWMPRLLGDFRGIPAGLSLRLFVLGTRSVWVLFLFLSPRARVLMETRIPGGPHIKTRGIAALGFQTNITHFLCCLRDRGHGGLSPEDLPPLSPSTSPPPHPTRAAKSKCQSRRRRCIPSKGQLVVATEGSVACLRLF